MFALFQMPATEGGAGKWTSAQRQSSRSPGGETSGGGSLHRQKEGPPAETAPSALPVIWELVIGGLTSAFMVVLGS